MGRRGASDIQRFATESIRARVLVRTQTAISVAAANWGELPVTVERDYQGAALDEAAERPALENECHECHESLARRAETVRGDARTGRDHLDRTVASDRSRVPSATTRLSGSAKCCALVDLGRAT